VVLGSGRFGKVYQIQLGPRQFALKVVDLAQAIEEQRKLVEKEIKIMRYVDCDQVVKLVRHHQAFVLCFCV
jgi:serine/threonine protein kinase